MAAAPKKPKEVAYEKASPLLLSEQGSPVVYNDYTSEEWQDLRSHLEQRLVSLRNWRESWWTQNWANLATYLLPRRSIWVTQSAGGFPSPNNMTRGREINTSIVDPTGTYALRVCAAGLMSGLASPSRPWFSIIPGMKNFQMSEDAQNWVDDTTDRIYAVLAGSNFYNSFAQECEDISGFGSAPNIIYEDDDDLIRLYNPCVGEYFLATDATMRIDGLFRAFVFTISQIVDMFGIDNCPNTIQVAWKQKGTRLDTEWIVAHAIEPNFDIKGAGKIPGNYAWREVYWIWGTSSEKPLSVRGFEEKPFTCARWSIQSNDAYGRSVGMDVLPDIMQLQFETRKKAEGIEKQVNPPLVADMELKNQPSSSLPGHVTYAANLSAKSGMRPIYQVQPDLRGMMEDLKEIQQRIKVGFFNDLFLSLSEMPTEQRTAFEVSQRIFEKMQILGPVIEGLIADSLKPKLKRIYKIMERKGMIEPLPDSLKGIPLDITFTSILAVAQKAAATGGVERLAAFIGNLAAVYPDAKDMLDVDQTIEEYNDLLGNKQNLLRGKEQVDQLRKASAQQQAQAAAMNAAHGAAQTASVGADAASTLASIPMNSGGNAISQLLAGGSQ